MNFNLPKMYALAVICIKTLKIYALHNYVS